MALLWLESRQLRCNRVVAPAPSASNRRSPINALTPLICAAALLLTTVLAGCESRPPLEYALPLWEGAAAEAGESVLTAALSADGAVAAVTTVDGMVSVWDVEQRKEIQRWPAREFGGGAQFLRFVDGGNALILAGVDHSVEPSAERQGGINYFMLRDTRSGSIRRVWTMEGARLTALAASADGATILAGFSNGLMVLFAANGATREDFSLHTSKITDLALSRDGRYVLSSSVDSRALFWEVDSGEILQTFNHKNRSTRVAADAEFRTGFTSDALDNQRLWNLRSGDLIAPLQHHQRWMYIARARFTDDGRRLLLASPSKAVSVWNPVNGDNIARWYIDFPVIDVAENHYGDLVTIGSTGLLEVWKRTW